jgi:hypothetical protein
MGLIMSQTASDSLLSEPHNCLIVGFGVEVGVGVGVEVEVGAATGVKVGFGAALIANPLFHTNRVPDLTQVNFFPPEIEVAPAFVHFAPAFTAAPAEVPLRISVPTISGVKAWMLLRILKVKPSQCTFSMTFETKT